jgi:hypothetical protein
MRTRMRIRRECDTWRGRRWLLTGANTGTPTQPVTITTNDSRRCGYGCTSPLPAALAQPPEHKIIFQVHPVNNIHLTAHNLDRRRPPTESGLTSHVRTGPNHDGAPSYGGGRIARPAFVGSVIAVAVAGYDLIRSVTPDQRANGESAVVPNAANVLRQSRYCLVYQDVKQLDGGASGTQINTTRRSCTNRNSKSRLQGIKRPASRWRPI